MYIYPLMSKEANEEVKALAFGVIAALVREGNFTSHYMRILF